MTHSSLPPVLRRWRLFAAAMAVTALAGGGVLLAANSDPATALAFHTVPTVRVLDTRPATQVGTRSTPLGLAGTLDLVIPGLPDDATGVNINVTVDGGTEGSFLTVYPKGDARPTTSTVNWDAAGAVANTATVDIHADHTVTIYNLKGTVDVIVDLLGYYAPSPAGPGTAGVPGTPGAPGPAGQNAPGFVMTHVVGTDSSVCGDDWANLDYTRTLQFIPQDDGTIHVVRSYTGTFTTIAGVPGPQPGLPPVCPGTLQTGGVTGTFSGYDVAVVTGGVFTPNATCADPCTTTAMLAAFFPGALTAVSTITDGWEYQYDAGANGQWINRSAARGGNVGTLNG